MTIRLRAVPVLLASTAIIGCRPSRPATAAPAPVPTYRPRPALVPQPASLTVAGGAPFALDSTTAIVVQAPSDSSLRVAEALATQLRPATGFPLTIAPETTPSPRGRMRLAVDRARGDLGEEGYALLVTPDSLNLVAATVTGLFRGTQTIRQLLPWGIEAENPVIKMGDWKIPALSITDRPRFGWRGAMLDVARHFFTVDEVKQYIDILALYKLNVLHLHLSDDQGWRIEIKSRPALVEMGSALQVGGNAGGFYTQANYSDIVRYAADRFITIVPEIDMPGHTNAMLIPTPELSCGRQAPATYTNIRVGFSALCPEKEDTYRLVDDVVREIAAITPGPYFHIGGDEVETLTRDQYVLFVERVQEIVGRHGKRMVGWEEIWKARLRPTTLVQQWHTDSARNAVQYGSKIILSPASKTYLDMKYGASTELGLRWAGLIDVETAYAWDPATHIAGIAETNIAGVEAPLWAETIRNITAAEFLAMPRLPTLAEVGWTPQALRRWDEFRDRLAAHAPRWRLMGINYYASPLIRWQ